MRHYYSILEVEPGSTTSQIRNAYRQKAKQYHPDRNPHRDTTAQFIAIHDAYELLMAHKTGSPVHNKKRSGSKAWATQSRYEDYHEKKRREQEEARARAEEQARKREERLQSSFIYRAGIFTYYCFHYFYLLFGIAIVLIPLKYAKTELYESSFEYIEVICPVFIGTMLVWFALDEIKKQFAGVNSRA